MTNDRSVRDQARQAVRALASDRPAPSGLDRLGRNAMRTLDAQLARLPGSSRSGIACAKGCSLCCHLRVMASATEVLALVGYLRRELADDRLRALATTIAASAAALRALPRERLLLTNMPCPLLVDGACSVYPARPLSCRAYHSLDLAACQISFDHPTDLTLTHPQSALTARVHEGVQDGLRELQQAAGVDVREYELVTALDEALTDPGCPERLAAGQAVFRTAIRP